MLKGIDVSNHQKNKIDFSKYDFVMIKASEGSTYKDAYLDAHYNRIHGGEDGKPDMGQLYGFYHFARPENNTPAHEVENFLNLVGHHAGYAMYALDWEGKALYYPIEWAREWLDTVYRKTGVKPLFYCSGSYTGNIGEILKGDYGLWVAEYGVKKPKKGVYPFWTMWQYTSNPIDHDFFNGDKETWKKYIKRR